MGRINNQTAYPQDTSVSLTDFLIGSDVKKSGLTQTYSLQSILNVINTANGISSVQYKFSLDDNIHATESGRITTNTSQVDPTNITFFKFSTKDLNGTDLTVLLTNFDANKSNLVINLSEPSNPNSINAFKVTGISTTVDFITLSVERFKTLSTENFVDNKIYAFSFFFYDVIVPGSINNSDLADVPTNTFKARASAGTGSPEDITATQARTILNVEDGADVTDTTNVEAAGAVMETDTTTAAMLFVIDEDDMISDLDTKVPTQQSVKAFVTAQVATSTLQATYDASTTPEIITNATLGALTIKRGSPADTDNVLEVKNSGGTTTFFVTGEGRLTSAGITDKGSTTTITIDVNENVGLGTTTPETLFHIKSSGIETQLKIEGGKSTVLSAGEINSSLLFGSNDVSVGGTGEGANQIGGKIASITEFSNGTLVGMGFYTFDQGVVDTDFQLREVMRLDNQGRLGLGTKLPTVKLQIISDDTEGTPTFTSDVTGVFQNNTAAATNNSINLISGTTGNSSIKFGTSVNNDLGSIGFFQDDLSMRYFIDGVTKFAVFGGATDRVNILDKTAIGYPTTFTATEVLDVLGNILASGTVLGSNLSGTNTGDETVGSISGLGFLKNTTDTLTGDLTVTGNFFSGNLDITGEISTTSKLNLGNGDNVSGTLDNYQLRFGFDGTNDFPSFISTKHNSSANGNAINFWTGDGTQSGVFSTNAVIGMSIENGQVSIGKENPTESLDVIGNIKGSGNLDIAGNFNSLGIDDNATSTAITINASEDVGIGIVTANARLHVKNSVEEVIRLESGTTGSIHFNEGGTLRGIVGYSNGTSISLLADPGDMVIRAEPGNALHFSIGGASKFKVNSAGVDITSNFNSLGIDDNATSTAITIDASENIGLGTTTFGTSAAKSISIGNGTAPTTSIVDGIQLYAEDVNGSSELKVRNEAGIIKTLSKGLALFIKTSDKTIANTTIETTLFSTGVGSNTILAEDLILGNKFKIKLQGIVSDTGNPSAQMIFRLGSTVILDTGLLNTLMIGVTTSHWILDAEVVIRTEGVTGTLMASGSFVTSAGDHFPLFNLTTTVIDTTIDQAVDATFQWGIANVLNTITCQIAETELITI